MIIIFEIRTKKVQNYKLELFTRENKKLVFIYIYVFFLLLFFELVNIM